MWAGAHTASLSAMQTAASHSIKCPNHQQGNLGSEKVDLRAKAQGKDLDQGPEMWEDIVGKDLVSVMNRMLESVCECVCAHLCLGRICKRLWFTIVGSLNGVRFCMRVH